MCAKALGASSWPAHVSGPKQIGALADAQPSKLAKHGHFKCVRVCVCVFFGLGPRERMVRLGVARRRAEKLKLEPPHLSIAPGEQADRDKRAEPWDLLSYCSRAGWRAARTNLASVSKFSNFHSNFSSRRRAAPGCHFE